MTISNALELKNVTKTYDGFLLDHLNLSLPSGYIMGLIGENGAGKSTSIKLILDLISREEGSITILGEDNQTGLGRVKENLGVVLDESCFPENMSGEDVSRIQHHIYRSWDQKLFFSYLNRFSIPNKKKIKEYSHGMKRKLAIAVALSHDAKLLLLDEATSGLDPVARDEILDVFLEFIQAEDRSILLSSHIISDMEKVCDYVAFLHKGKLIFSETKDELYDQFGLIRCSFEEWEGINQAAIRGYRKNAFGVEALVYKNRVPNSQTVERASIEEIMLFHVRENGGHQ